MKRVRGEQIHDSVQHFLRRRQHSHDIMDQKPDMDKITRATRHSIRQMALNRALLSEGSTSNCVTYSSATGDVVSCDQQYSKLRRFVTDAVQPYKNELSELLYPIFIHIFLELVINGHRTYAHKFFDRYHDQLVDQTHKERQRVIDTLRHTHMREDVVNNQLLASFREHKYVVFMKSETLDYLLRYLKAQDNVVLMQLFNQHLSVQVKEASNRIEPPHDLSSRVTETSPDGKKLHFSEGSDVTVGTLQKCIQRVRNSPPSISSISFYTLINTHQGLSSCSISPDQALLTAGFENSSIKVWALTPQLLTQKPPEVNISELTLGDEASERAETVTSEAVIMRGHSGPVYGTVFMPDSRFLLSCSEDSTLRLWDTELFSNVVAYRGHNYPVWDVDVSSLGYFASCSQDRTTRLWSTDRVYPLRTLVGHAMDVECVKFHPNGNYLATGSDDKSIRLWSIQEGKCVRLMQAHRSSVNSLSFSPDGQHLASAGEDRKVRLWDLSSGQMVKEFRGHTDVVYSLAFSCDGSMLASGGMDGALKVWDVKRGVSQSSQTDGTSPELLASFPTKATSVLYLNYVRYNVLQAIGGALN